ncbi:MAG: cysteine--tRNA ligase [Deltaproteobacteria bacterium CG11_big_fil_rev_8_21_14_0_20_47_16]|nr:MAG: cysteine--tRNA ligase [Deltaproteobacteria bacterium CG11_big_fil_rev_8_21_14_0_20_47_16]
MTLQLYNTLKRKKEEFKPITPGQVKMYVCGVTVWDYCHLGHARAAVTFDMVVRYLRYLGNKVTYVRNFTDVDDKIINRANKEKRDWKELAQFYIDDYEKSMSLLGCESPSDEPKASEYIQNMQDMIAQLIDNGHAYAASGDVFYAVRSFNGYGKLSGKKIDDLESGARVEVGETKRDPLDFALWKAAKPGEPAWKSPWGEGRPGWHIECSCMAKALLGDTFDIHGGGRDLIFPHHENEIAQSEGANGCEFARYWMHNGTLDIDSEKMSKSLGNYFTVHDVLKNYDPEVVRYFLLSANYRSPLNYTTQALDDAKKALDKIYETSARVKSNSAGPAADGNPTFAAAQAGSLPSASPAHMWFQKFTDALNDDFNTPKAYAVIFDAVRDVNRGDADAVAAWPRFIEVVSETLGFAGSNADAYIERQTQLATQKSGVDPAQIEQLLADRKAARAAKDFKKSDEIRDQLTAMGVTIKDRPDGTTEWKLS